MLSRRSRPIQLSTTARRRRSAAGFTLTEVLVVIGVIAVLIGIVTVGVTYVTASSKASATKVALGNLQSMIAELEANAGTNRQPDTHYLPGGTQTATGATLDFWNDADPTNATAPEPDPTPVPTVTTDNPKATMTQDFPAFRYDTVVVLNTQKAIKILQSIPRNRTAFLQLPAEQLMEGLPNPPGGPPASRLEKKTPAPASPAPIPFIPALPLDGWGNPIIFVPAGGLSGVTFEAHPGPDLKYDTPDDEPHVITSQGPLEPGYTMIPAGARAFWASAGPDGSFITGDDNVYSFEN